MATGISPPGSDEGLSTDHGASRTNDEITLLDVLVLLAERRRIVLFATFGCAFIAVVVSLVLPQSFTATSTILPPQQSSSVGSLLASQLGSMGSVAALAGGSLGIKNPNDMFIGLLKSRTVEDAMVQRFNLMQEYHDRYPSDARKDLESHTNIDGSGKDGLIRISIDDRDPKRAADLTNGYIDQFRKLSEHLAVTEASQRRLFFEQQLEDAKNNLEKAEEAMKQTEQRTGLIQLDSQARALIESSAAIRAQIAAKEVQIKSLQTFATEENSQFIQAQRELESLREQLAKLGGSESNPDSGLIVPRGKVPEVGMEYVRRVRDVKYYETIFEILARQFEIAKLDEAKQGALVQIVDLAVTPDRRSFPKRGLIVLLTTLFGFILGMIAALVQAGYARMRTDSDAKGKLKLLRQLILSGFDRSNRRMNFPQPD